MEKQVFGLTQVGEFLRNFLAKDSESYSEDDADLAEVLKKSEIENPWFTQESQRKALHNWAELFTEEKLNNWLKNYRTSKIQKKVGLILAGNIPLVGLHDVISVILSNHIPLIKLSSKDRLMLPFLLNKWRKLSEAEIPFEFIERLDNFDAVIATGSNNTARYLEFYFKDHLHIIRKNRTSAAVLSGNETQEDLEFLADDIFTYFGLGCRNVTRLFIPENMDLARIFESFTKYQDIVNHHKYANNYDYNRAVYLLNQDLFWDNNFVMLKEDQQLFSPLSVINFSRYSSLDEVKSFLQENEKDIQCVVANPDFGIDSIPLGSAQNPSLDTYADNVDTMRFLEVI
jgi:hypothetical protein